MRCKYCGYESPADFTFCPQCAYPAMECDRCLNGLCIDRPPIPDDVLKNAPNTQDKD